MPVRIEHGDSREILKTLAENSVDSVCTDPPYSLVSIQKRFGKPGSAEAKHGRDGLYRRASVGFMGQQWDTGEAAFDPEFWREVYRVLKPGAHLLAFGGTRTYHRLAVAIEDAGFEIRDAINWLYGCLSEDTQIVTQRGVEHYSKTFKGDLILCYDPSCQTYSWQKVQRVYEYEIEDIAYRLQSDSTDQLVSRTHRCLVESGGMETFRRADTLEQEIYIPVLEDLQNLLEALSHNYPRTSKSKPNLWSCLRGEICIYFKRWYRKIRRSTQRQKIGILRRLWQEILSQYKAFGSCKNSSLFLSMQWCFAWRGVETTRTQRTGSVVQKVGGCLSRTLDGVCQSFVEGGRYLSTAKRQLYGCGLYALPTRIFKHVEKRWICNDTPANGCSGAWTVFNSAGNSTPRRPRYFKQLIAKLSSFREQSRPQTIRGWVGHKTTLARVRPEFYRGKIWCVSVPTGCFVAVRNGMAFPTGNSGFPKNLSVSKQMDRISGAKRKVISPRLAHEYYTTEPATEEAKKWDGWGTALKPAVEIICVARKPLSESSIAANVLKWGTGAFNINACMIETGGRPARQIDPKAEANGVVYSGRQTPGSGFDGGSKAVGVTDAGRWPANVCHDGSEEVLETFPDAPGQQADISHTAPSEKFKKVYGKIGREGEASADRTYTDAGGTNFAMKPGARRNDSGSAARFFYTSKADAHDRWNSRHPTVKPVDLMRWLVRLVTPVGGTVLDPFAGSGPTGAAAMIEECNAILIEREDQYVMDILDRIEWLETDERYKIYQNADDKAHARSEITSVRDAPDKGWWRK